MEKIYKKIEELKNTELSSIPLILDPKNEADKKQLETLLRQDAIKQVNDDYVEQIKELYAIKNPTLVFQPDFKDVAEKFIKEEEEKSPLYLQVKWVFYPWLSTLVHILDDEDFQMVRTARNRYLITPEEQKIFYNAVVGIGGLSVGNSVALAIVLQGGARHIKLADF